MEAEEEWQRTRAEALNFWQNNELELRSKRIRTDAEWSLGNTDLESFRQAGAGLRGWGEGTWFGKEIEQQADKLSDTARELGLTFQSAFEDAVIAGKDFSDVLQGIEKDLLRVAARRLVTEPLVKPGPRSSAAWASSLRVCCLASPRADRSPSAVPAAPIRNWWRSARPQASASPSTPAPPVAVTFRSSTTSTFPAAQPAAPAPVTRARWRRLSRRRSSAS
jgi:hypothetical protein